MSRIFTIARQLGDLLRGLRVAFADTAADVPRGSDYARGLAHGREDGAAERASLARTNADLRRRLLICASGRCQSSGVGTRERREAEIRAGIERADANRPQERVASSPLLSACHQRVIRRGELPDEWKHYQTERVRYALGVGLLSASVATLLAMALGWIS